MAIWTYISIINLNINRLNDPSKTHKLAEWIQKEDPCIYAVYKKPTSDLKTHIDWKWKEWKNIFHANGKQKKAGVAILILDKTDLKIKNITRDKGGDYIMIKGSIQEEDVTIVNTYAPNIWAPQYIRQRLTDMKGESDSNIIIVGDFTPHSHQWTDHQNRKLIRKHES